jgi:uncharacterized damage-inducible protein DinB
MFDLKFFLEAWDWEAKKTVAVLESLAPSQYDFRPDPKGRSLGEMAWHLPESEAYMTYAIEKGRFDLADKPPGIERPRTIEALAPGYRRVHEEAVARVKKLGDADLERTLKFFDGSDMSIGIILLGAVFKHVIHHRGQLMLLNRMAGGSNPEVYGPTREQTEQMMRARN